MVSIRKRRHLGIQEKYKILNQLNRLKHTSDPKVILKENVYAAGSISSFQSIVAKREVSEAQAGPSSIDCSMSKPLSNNSSASSLKSRKSSRRKQADNQESCMLRGVYFKNMKWQAAIKVEKKQIHLGTVASMEEAAHLYDRAAYLCGRVPNFDLSEEEKQELQGLQWDEFLLMTKEAIANKKKQKRVETCMRRQRISDGDPPHGGTFNQLACYDDDIQKAVSFQQQQMGPFNQQPISLASSYQEPTFHAPKTIQETSLSSNCYIP